MSADGLAPSGDRSFAGIVLTKYFLVITMSGGGLALSGARSSADSDVWVFFIHCVGPAVQG